MSLTNLFRFLSAQHVSDINISITRNLRLFCWITTLVVLFLVRCVLEFQCGWVGVVSVLQDYQELATILLNYHIGLIVLGSMCVGVSVWLGWSGIRVAGLSGARDYSVELPHWSYCSWFDVCWSFGVVSLQHGFHSNPTTPKLHQTSNQEQYYQCGNSTE